MSFLQEEGSHCPGLPSQAVTEVGRVKPARQVVARITVQGLRQLNGLTQLSQEQGKIICSACYWGAIFTPILRWHVCQWQEIVHGNRHQCLFLRDSEEGIVSPCHGAEVHGASIKVPLTRKMYISVNEAVPWVKTNGDTKSCYTYVQIGKNLQLPVAVLLKISHFLDDVTRGTVHRVNVLQMRISAILVFYSGSEMLAYRR